jgi:hypothetical protein
VPFLSAEKGRQLSLGRIAIGANNWAECQQLIAEYVNSDSLPPAIIVSAYPCLIVLAASPMATAEDEHVVLYANTGPVNSNSAATKADGALYIVRITVKG